jgi:hypothetical protein
VHPAARSRMEHIVAAAGHESDAERLPDHSEASSGSFDQPGSADGTTSLEVLGRPNRQYTIDGRNTAEGSL